RTSSPYGSNIWTAALGGALSFAGGVVMKMLKNRNAIVYGAGGSIGRAVATAFAREGATVHLAGRTLDRLETVADEIRKAGGKAQTAVVDVLDEQAVDEHADAVANQ